MNIYISIEISARELDGRLLLAVIAASRGNDVLVGDKLSLQKGAESGALAPGIFHKKCLTPSEEVIERNDKIIRKGFVITSMDEEASLVDQGYEKPAIRRYSDKTMGQASAVFCWGDDDQRALREHYPSFKHKIYKTGSPRVDLWKTTFKTYWEMQPDLPNQPFLLVASNMALANNRRPFHEILRSQRQMGYFVRDQEMLPLRFNATAEDYLKTLAFIEAISSLDKAADGYEIILRPHPSENIEAWRVYLEGMPNVRVVREGAITPWIQKAFAVIHNSCTSAIEAVISGVPVLTYLPFDQAHGRDIPNRLGLHVKTPEALVQGVQGIFEDAYGKGDPSEREISHKAIARKIFMDERELAAEKISGFWEDLKSSDLSRGTNWMAFRYQLKRQSLKSLFRNAMMRKGEAQSGLCREDRKFPPLDAKDIRWRVKKLCAALSIEEEINCQLLGQTVIRVAPRGLSGDLTEN